jgi:3'(2'), 5'-bisphosphate nucleotidase
MGPHELRAVGSSIKLCVVADGNADLYPRLGPTSEWDIAAGQAVLEAAGGQVVTATEGQALRYNTKASYLNPDFLAYGDPRCYARWQAASSG